ncbi:hypothetical protein Q7689_01465 [Nocardiopsis tropica]|uniref:hypothetical protein n=1 Tax=Nocardiopsis tropica TaxID=109330 RepID=UPI002E8D8959|nr:hypothetical protein [Nocardiopsis tropica]
MERFREPLALQPAPGERREEGPAEARATVSTVMRVALNTPAATPVRSTPTILRN